MGTAEDALPERGADAVLAGSDVKTGEHPSSMTLTPAGAAGSTNMQGLWEHEWLRLDQRHAAEVQQYRALLSEKSRELDRVRYEQQRRKPTHPVDIELAVVEAEMAAFTSTTSNSLSWLEDVLAACQDNMMRHRHQMTLLQQRTREPGELKRFELERVLAEQHALVESLQSNKLLLERENAAQRKELAAQRQETSALSTALMQVRGDHNNLIQVVQAIEAESKGTIHKEAELAQARGQVKELQAWCAASEERVAQFHAAVDKELDSSREGIATSERASHDVAHTLAQRSSHAAAPSEVSDPGGLVEQLRQQLHSAQEARTHENAAARNAMHQAQELVAEAEAGVKRAAPGSGAAQPVALLAAAREVLAHLAHAVQPPAEDSIGRHAEGQATASTGAAPPSELKGPPALYQEFQEDHSKALLRPLLAVTHFLGPGAPPGTQQARAEQFPNPARTERSAASYEAPHEATMRDGETAPAGREGAIPVNDFSTEVLHDPSTNFGMAQPHSDPVPNAASLREPPAWNQYAPGEEGGRGQVRQPEWDMEGWPATALGLTSEELPGLVTSSPAGTTYDPPSQPRVTSPAPPEQMRPPLLPPQATLPMQTFRADRGQTVQHYAPSGDSLQAQRADGSAPSASATVAAQPSSQPQPSPSLRGQQQQQFEGPPEQTDTPAAAPVPPTPSTAAVAPSTAAAAPSTAAPTIKTASLENQDKENQEGKASKENRLKRQSTLGKLFGGMGSIFGSKKDKDAAPTSPDKKKRSKRGSSSPVAQGASSRNAPATPADSTAESNPAAAPGQQAPFAETPRPARPAPVSDVILPHEMPVSDVILPHETPPRLPLVGSLKSQGSVRALADSFSPFGTELAASPLPVAHTDAAPADGGGNAGAEGHIDL